MALPNSIHDSIPPSLHTIQNADGGIQELYQRAFQARQKAHAIYSGYQVGAAIRVQGGEIYTGCNVENASYGATVCAERVAIQKAVSEIGNLQILEIMVVTQAPEPWPPCGLCRQVISEFARNIPIYLANLEGVLEIIPFEKLFPRAFNQNQLNSSQNHP